jgi:hypothetical protein
MLLMLQFSNMQIQPIAVFINKVLLKTAIFSHHLLSVFSRAAEEQTS